MEFGLRRAQGADAGIYGARAAVIGGCSSTSNVLAGQVKVKVLDLHVLKLKRLVFLALSLRTFLQKLI